MRAPSLVLIGARVSGGAGVGTCAVAVGWVDCHEDSYGCCKQTPGRHGCTGEEGGHARSAHMKMKEREII